MTDVASAPAGGLQSRARAAGYDPDRLDATALLVGVGAAGQNTGLNLALSGLQEIRVVDGDRFEEHNQTRSPGYPFGDPHAAGRAKAPTVATWLRRCATHPRATVRWADAWIEELGAGVFDGVDVVVSCVDSLRARAYLSDRCRALGLPLVEAGFGGPEVNIGVYPVSEVDACWRCGREIHDEVVSCRVVAAQAEQAGVVPAIQAAAATVGGLQAEAIVQVLHGHEPRPRRLWLDIRSGAAIGTALVADPDCQGIHRRHPDPVDLGVTVDATAEEVLDRAGRLLPGAPQLVLPSPYLERETCAVCARSVDVGGPGWSYSRNPRCAEHGGPWPLSPDGAVPLSPVPLVRPGAEQAALSCRRLGFAPGDHVLVRDTATSITARLAGDTSELLSDA